MLRFRADVRPLLFNAVYFGLLTWAFVSVPLGNLWVSLPLFAALCLTSFMGAVQTHNAVHCPIFKQRWLNKIYQVVLTCTYGHPVSSLVPGHTLSHHKHTQSRKDVMRTTKAQFRWHLLNGLFFLFIVAPYTMKADAAYTKMMRTRHPRWFRQMVFELSVLWAVQIALFVVDWQKALVFWFIPHIYAQWGLVGMNMLQHDGTDPDHPYNHSRNFVGKAVNWWAYNNGFHDLHHMQPGLHWSVLPEKHAELVAPYIHPNLDQKSLLVYLFKTFGLNQRLDYLGNPIPLPESGPDEEWIPDPRTTAADLGAEGIEPALAGT
ncbi:MAG: fatty acid desaturase [Sandaracinaceae bacterium]|nr:fatty acid desaturase [Sandaracinaceae bacterium]